MPRENRFMTESGTEVEGGLTPPAIISLQSTSAAEVTDGSTLPKPGGHSSSSKNDGRKKDKRRFAPLILPATLAVLWWIFTALEVFPQIVLPRPQRVWKIAVALWPILPDAWLITIEMVGLGLLFGGIAGLGVGLSFGYSKWARSLLELTTDVIRPVPLFALIPLFVLWFGIGKTPQIALIAMGVFLILTIHTTEAVRNVPLIFVKAALVSGATRFQVYRTVVIPAIVPHMLAAIRFAVMSAWGLDVAAEFMGSREGLGYIMLVRNVYLDTAGVVLIVFIFAGMAILSDFIIRVLTLKVTRWSPRGLGAGVAGEIIGR